MAKNISHFTVAICTRNRPEYLDNLLIDLQNQNLPPKKYIFVENIKEHQHLSRQKIASILKHPHIKYLTTTGNKSVSQNLCLQHTTTNSIIFVDDDIRIKPQTFKKIIEASQMIPNADAISLRTIHPNNGPYSTFANYWYNWGSLNKTKPQIKTIAPTTVLYLNVSQLKKYSIHYDERYNFSEDLDLFCQLKNNHLTLYYLPTITVLHFFGNRHHLFPFLNRFSQYGFDNMIALSDYPHLIHLAWVIPTRRLHYLFLPFFYIKNVFKQSAKFIKDNRQFPIFLYPLCFLVFFYLDLGLYKAYFTKKYPYHT